MYVKTNFLNIEKNLFLLVLKFNKLHLSMIKLNKTYKLFKI